VTSPGCIRGQPSSRWTGVDANIDNRIQDLELGRRLGYERLRKIRALIKSRIAGGFLVFDDQRGAAPQKPRTRGRPAGEYWLTEEQAFFVTTQSGTARARTLTLQLVRVFVTARRALHKPILDMELVGRVEGALALLVAKYEQIERMAMLESSGAFGVRALVLIPGRLLSPRTTPRRLEHVALLARGVRRGRGPGLDADDVADVLREAVAAETGV